MSETAIVRVRVYAVAPETTPRFRFAGPQTPFTMIYNIVRLTLANGVEGAAGVDSHGGEGTDTTFAELFRPVVDGLLGRDIARREAIAAELLAAKRHPVPDPESLLDIAMWDAWGRHVGQPLWRLLGGFRERIPAYASSPLFDTVEEYLDYCRRVQAMGYKAVKFHTRCEPEFELALAAAVSEAFGPSGLRFMIDLEMLYGFDDALRLAETLSALPCDWLEAPLPDTEIEAYAELNRAVGVDILAAGNTVVELPAIADALGRGAWSRLRCDPCNVGGITTARRAMALAEGHGMPTELQSYGYPLSQAANLHLMLGLPRCTWFEHPVPVEHYEYGSANPIRIEADGCVTAPAAPGLGLEMEWERIEADATLVLDTAA